MVITYQSSGSSFISTPEAIVNHFSDLEILKGRVEAVQVVVTEVPDLAQAWRYAVELTQKHGGAVL